jgi:alkaline phosphatase D
MRFIADARPDNVVAITGDIHSSWVADLRLDFDDAASPALATELVGTSLSSGGDGSDDTSALARIQTDNPHIHFYDRRRGYVRCTLTPQRWTADYRIVPYVSRPGAPIETRATFVIEAGRAGAHRA